MNNPLFERLSRYTATLKGNTGRLAKILLQLPPKLKQANFQRDSLREKIDVLRRMFRAYVRGVYRDVPWKTIAAIAAAFVYLIDPFDLVPDFIVVGGLLDDITVIVWVYGMVRNEVDKFLIWEGGRALPAGS